MDVNSDANIVNSNVYTAEDSAIIDQPVSNCQYKQYESI